MSGWNETEIVNGTPGLGPAFIYTLSYIANICHVLALAWAVGFYGREIRQSRVINLSWFAGIFLVLAPKVPHPRKPLSLRQTRTVGHPHTIPAFMEFKV